MAMPAKNTRAFEFKLGKVGLTLLVAGLSLLLFGVFVFGVSVGKHIDTAPEFLAQLLPGMARDRILVAFGGGGRTEPADRRESPAVPPVPAPARSGAPMGREGGKEPAGADPLPAQARAEPAGRPTPPSGPAPPEKRGQGTAGATVPAAPAAGGGPAGPGPNAYREGDPRQERPEEDRYLIQAASSRRQQRAEELNGRLRQLGYASRIVATDLPGRGRWYRIVVGDFGSFHEAQLVADAMQNKVSGLRCVVYAGERAAVP